MAGEIPAGWYPNPWNANEELYWSGADWSGISRVARRSTVAAQNPPLATAIDESTVIRPTTRDAGVPTAVDHNTAPPIDLSYGSQPTSTFTPLATPTAAAPREVPPLEPAPPIAPAAPYPQADPSAVRWALSSAASTAPPYEPRARFGLAALIFGIGAAVFGVIPGPSFAAWMLAFPAIGLGIAGFVSPSNRRGFSLAAIITGATGLIVGTAVSIALIVALGWLR